MSSSQLQSSRLLPRSLADGRLPSFYLVSFRIGEPGERPTLGSFDCLEPFAALLAQDPDNDGVVDRDAGRDEDDADPVDGPLARPGVPISDAG